MKSRKSSTMRKYYQLLLLIICFISVVALLIYRHEYYRLRYVLEVLNFFGKPGLSEIEFCGPGYNATLLTEILKNSSMEVRETAPYFQQIDKHFYTYSSFFISHKTDLLQSNPKYTIDTIAIGTSKSEPNFRCNAWFENTIKPKTGRFSYTLQSIVGSDFKVFIFHCSINRDFGKPKGVSFYVNNYDTNPLEAPIIKTVEIISKRTPKVSTGINFINNIEPAVCVMPNKVPIVTKDALMEFLVFHRILGVKHFTIYDSMVSEDIIKRLNLIPADITQWDIKFYPLNFPFIYADSYNVVRKAVELDCLYRHFKLNTIHASHLLLLSWDEFLVPRFHNTVKSALDEFDPTRKFTSLQLQTLTFCLNQEDDENSPNWFPNMLKKTHYYLIPEAKMPILIRNLDGVDSVNKLFKNTSKNGLLPTSNVCVHKYMECKDSRGKNGYNQTQMEVLQHKFEGAMLKFGPTFMSDKVYALHKSGQIWGKRNENVRDML